MKIALELKDNSKDKIIKELEKRNFRISNSLNAIWVYDIRVIHQRKEKLVLEHIDIMNEIAIDFDDIEYFEIHSN